MMEATVDPGRLDVLRCQLEAFLACRSDFSLINNAVHFVGDSSFATLLSNFTEHVEAYPSVLANIHQCEALDYSEVNHFVNARSSEETWKDPIDIDKFLLIFAFACRLADATRGGEKIRRVAVTESREELANHISHCEEYFSRIEDDVYDHTKQLRRITASVNDISAKQDARYTAIENHQGELQTSLSEEAGRLGRTDEKIKSLERAIIERWDHDADNQLDLVFRVAKLEVSQENNQRDKIQLHGMISSARDALSDTQSQIQTWETRSLETDTLPIYSSPDIPPAFVSDPVQQVSPPPVFRSLAEEMGDESSLESYGQQGQVFPRRNSNRPSRGNRGRRFTIGPHGSREDALAFSSTSPNTLSNVADIHPTDGLTEGLHQNEPSALREGQDQALSTTAIEVAASPGSALIYEVPDPTLFPKMIYAPPSTVESALPSTFHDPSPDLLQTSACLPAHNSAVAALPNNTAGGAAQYSAGLSSDSKVSAESHKGCATFETTAVAVTNQLDEIATAKELVDMMQESLARESPIPTIESAVTVPDQPNEIAAVERSMHSVLKPSAMTVPSESNSHRRLEPLVATLRDQPNANTTGVHEMLEPLTTAIPDHSDEITTKNTPRPVHPMLETSVTTNLDESKKNTVHVKLNHPATPAPDQPNGIVTMENSARLSSTNFELAYEHHGLTLEDLIHAPGNHALRVADVDVTSCNQGLGTKIARMRVFLSVFFLIFSILLVGGSVTRRSEKPLVSYSIGEGYMVKMDIYSRRC